MYCKRGSTGFPPLVPTTTKMNALNTRPTADHACQPMPHVNPCWLWAKAIDESNPFVRNKPLRCYWTLVASWVRVGVSISTARSTVVLLLQGWTIKMVFWPGSTGFSSSRHHRRPARAPSRSWISKLSRCLDQQFVPGLGLNLCNERESCKVFRTTSHNATILNQKGRVFRHYGP